MTRNPCKPLSLLSAALMLTLAAPITTYATEAGDWLVHIRALNVNPDDDSDEITLDGAKLAGSEAHVEDGWTLGIDTTYMMTANWGVTLMLDLSSQHSISVNVPALGGDQGKIGDVRVLPPSLLLQYHFLPKSSFQPYVGAGVNYTIFFDEGTKDSKLGSGSDMDVNNSWAPIVQAGLDMKINDDWLFNVDVKYIDLDTDANIKSALGNLEVDVDIDPWVFGIGVGRRF